MVMTLLTRPKKTVATVVVATDGSGDFNTDGTDDDVQIQAAIDSLPATGGCIYMKEGTYNITNTITIASSNVSLIGCGFSTHIRLTDGANVIIISVGDGGVSTYEHITIEFMQFDGNRTNNAFSLAIYFNRNVNESIVRDCWVHEFPGDSPAVYVLFSTSFLGTGNIIYDCGDYGLEVDNCNNSILSYNIVTNCAGYGLIVQDSNYVNVVGNNCSEMNARAGITYPAGITLSNSDDCVVVGNICNDNLSTGIYTTSTDNICVVGNHCFSNDQYGINLFRSINGTTNSNICVENGYHGIFMHSDVYSTVSNNVCQNNSQDTGNTYSGIFLDFVATPPGNCQYNVLSGNNCSDTQTGSETQRYGIEEDDVNQDYNIITGNVCTNNVTGGINSLGVNDQVFNNIET